MALNLMATLNEANSHRFCIALWNVNLRYEKFTASIAQ